MDGDDKGIDEGSALDFPLEMWEDVMLVSMSGIERGKILVSWIENESGAMMAVEKVE